MKTFIRIVVLVVVTLLLVAGGFWLGTRYKPQNPEEPLASLQSDLKEKAEALGKAGEGTAAGDTAPAPAGGDALPPASETGQAMPEKPKMSEAPKTPSLTEPGKTESPSAAPPAPVKDQPTIPPQKMDSGKTAEAGVAPAATPPANKPQMATPETVPAAPAPAPVSAPAPSASAPAPTTAPPAPPPAQAAATPPATDPLLPPGDANGGDKKDAPPPIMTPEDLGKNNIYYSIQAGAFLERDLAQSLLEDLQVKKYPAYLVSAWDNKRQLWHTVRVGRYTDLTTARLAADTLSQKERIDAFVYGIGSLRYDSLQEPEPPAPAVPTANAAPAPQTQTASKE